jgi:hypothetical protein
MMMLMVMPCYDHAQMMLKCKANTWGVTARTMSIQGSTREEMMGDGKQIIKAKLKAKVYA